MWLAIDTATDPGSVALGAPGDVVAAVTLGPRAQARDLAPAIAGLLADQGLPRNAITGLVVADGPGSFTGLRIGWAMAQGLAAARSSLEVHAAPSLLAAAWQAAQRHGVTRAAAAYDALRGEVFAAMYEFPPGAVEVIMPPSLMSVDELSRHPAPAIVVSDDTATNEAFRNWTGVDPQLLAGQAPSAAGLLHVMALGGTQRVRDVAAFTPAYGRKAAAQVRWEAEHERTLPHS